MSEASVDGLGLYLNNVSLSKAPPRGHSHLITIQLLHGYKAGGDTNRQTVIIPFLIAAQYNLIHTNTKAMQLPDHD